MMQLPKPRLQNAIFLLLALTSLAIGCFIPSFYVWTDSDQSRPSPLLWQVPLAGVAAAVIACCVLPWLPIQKEEHCKKSSNVRLSTRKLLLSTTVIALACALLIKLPSIATALIALASVAYFGYAVTMWPSARLAAGALVACMVLPFAWVLAPSPLSQAYPKLLLFLGLPAFVPASLASGMAGHHPQEVQWLFVLLSAIELLIGIWIIKQGPRRAIACLMWVLLVSAFGSLVLHQMVLA